MQTRSSLHLKGTIDVFTVGKAEFGFDDIDLIPSMGAFPHRPMILCGLPAPSADELVRAVNRSFLVLFFKKGRLP